jgi:hypothetical protein
MHCYIINQLSQYGFWVVMATMIDNIYLTSFSGDVVSKARYWLVVVSITDNPLNRVGISGASRKNGCLIIVVAGVLSLPIHTELSGSSVPSLNLIAVTFN